VNKDFCVDCDKAFEPGDQKHELMGWNYGDYGLGEYVCDRCGSDRYDMHLDYVNS